MSWPEDTPAIHKTLVLGNLRGFVKFLAVHDHIRDAAAYRAEGTKLAPKPETWNHSQARQIAMAGLGTGHVGTAKLALQLAGFPACDECDYLKQHCRCDRPEGCQHEWVSARNKIVTSGEMCVKCRALNRPECGEAE